MIFYVKLPEAIWIRYKLAETFCYQGLKPKSVVKHPGIFPTHGWDRFRICLG
jgi:hypothetical protein